MGKIGCSKRCKEGFWLKIKFSMSSEKKYLPDHKFEKTYGFFISINNT